MANETLKAGDLVQNLVGHWMEIIEVVVPDWQFRVQPLTEVGTTLSPLGSPVRVGRSDLRLMTRGGF